MVLRWAASAWLLTEKRFRKIICHREMWALASILERKSVVQQIVPNESKIA